MCQGVIGLFHAQTGAFYWGVGSHTELIKKIWPKSPETAGDRLVRFEATLAKGPGTFTVEGSACDDDMKEQIKTKLLAQTGTFELLCQYITKYGYDSAFINVFSSGASYIADNMRYDNEITKLDTQLRTENDVNAIKVRLIKERVDSHTTQSNAAADREVQSYYRKLTSTFKKANFNNAAEYAQFNQEVIQKVDRDVTRIRENYRLELEAMKTMIGVQIDGTIRDTEDAREKLRVSINSAINARKAQILRDSLKSYTLRSEWVATLAPAKA